MIYTLLTGHRLKLALVIMFCDALKKFLAYVDFPVYQKPGLHDLHMGSVWIELIVAENLKLKTENTVAK